MKRIGKKRGISAQLTYLIVIGIVVVGVATYFVQYVISRQQVRTETRERAAKTAMEMISTLREYPTY